MAEEKPKVLVVDDRTDDRESIVEALSGAGAEVIGVKNAVSALRLLESGGVAVLITDLKMPGVGGMELLKVASEKHADAEIIVITGYGTVESAVEAMKHGAYHYLTKPIDIDELRSLVSSAVERWKSRTGIAEGTERFHGLVGKSQAMREVYDQIARVGPVNATVLIRGETGTGKELVARAIHEVSKRSDGPFVALNCSALSEGVLESELFGHEKGAFTGAIARRIGNFEAAHGGTLFLDEVGDIPLNTQVKLLRVIESRELTRVGGSEPVKLDVRLIAATNKNIEAEIEQGKFREDLYYRLNVVTINLPPLRERKEDVSVLVEAFVREFSAERGIDPPPVDRDAMSKLETYSWPGNVRELRNIVESIVATLRDDTMTSSQLPGHLRGELPAAKSLNVFVGMTLDEITREAIQKTLLDVGGNRTKASEILGISRRTLIRKIKEYGL
jgi:DNA-binding NtrC family response regulator